MIVKNVDKTEKNKAKFQVEVDSAAFEEAVNKAYQQKKGSIYIQGFRKGKAPRNVIEGMYGHDVFYQDAVDNLAPQAFAFGAKEENFKIVGDPALADVNFAEDKTVTFTFSVELYPEVTLGEYKGLELEKDEAVVTDEQINAQLDSVRKRNARMIPVEDRAAQMGDTANIDFDGYLDGERFDGGKAEGYNLELGSNSFVPGFEDQVVGMKIGEEKDLNVTFPENYVENLAGKEVVFKVKLNDITVPEYPELDDNFAKDVSEFDTFEEYKADMEKQMLEKAQADVDDKYKSDLIKMASDNMTVDIPSIMIEDKVNEMINGYAQQFGVRGNDIPRDKLAEMLGIDEDTMNNSIRPAAESQVRADMLLDAIVQAENIEVSDEDADEYIAKVASNYGIKPEDLVNYFGKEFIVNEHKKELASDVLVNYAKNVKGKKMPKSDDSGTVEDEEKPEKKPVAKRTSKKAEAEGEEKAEKKPAAKRTSKKAEAEGEEKAEKKPATKRTAKKSEPKDE